MEDATEAVPFTVDEETKDFVFRSVHRQKVLLSLKKESKRPVDVSGESGLSRGSTSRALKQLEGRELVRCVTPKRRMNRFYELTGKGEQIADELRSRGVSLGREFEMEAARALDRVEVPYTRNEKIAGELFEVRPTFTVRSSEGSRLALFTVKVSGGSDLSGAKAAAFTSDDLKRGTANLKTVVLVGGLSRDSEQGSDVLKLEHPCFFDSVFFEDELEKLGEFLEGFVALGDRRGS